MSFVRIPDGVRISGYATDITPPTHNPDVVYCTGVLHAVDTTGRRDPAHYWIESVDLAPEASLILQAQGYDGVVFTPYSSPDAWTHRHE